MLTYYILEKINSNEPTAVYTIVNDLEKAFRFLIQKLNLQADYLLEADIFKYDPRFELKMINGFVQIIDTVRNEVWQIRKQNLV